MSTVNDYFQHAELALAAYATLTPGGSPSVIDLQDEGKGLSLKQADHFAETYTVVDQYNDPNGLSATVFEDGKRGRRELIIIPPSPLPTR